MRQETYSYKLPVVISKCYIKVPHNPSLAYRVTVMKSRASETDSSANTSYTSGAPPPSLPSLCLPAECSSSGMAQPACHFLWDSGGRGHSLPPPAALWQAGGEREAGVLPPCTSNAQMAAWRSWKRGLSLYLPLSSLPLSSLSLSTSISLPSLPAPRRVQTIPLHTSSL